MYYCTWTTADRMILHTTSCEKSNVIIKANEPRVFDFWDHPLLAAFWKNNWKEKELHCRLFHIKPMGEIVKYKNFSTCEEIVILEEVKLPRVFRADLGNCLVLVALEVCQEEKFVTWANNWLTHKDKTDKSVNDMVKYCESYGKKNKIPVSMNYAFLVVETIKLGFDDDYYSIIAHILRAKPEIDFFETYKKAMYLRLKEDNKFQLGGKSWMKTMNLAER